METVTPPMCLTSAEAVLAVTRDQSMEICQGAAGIWAWNVTSLVLTCSRWRWLSSVFLPVSRCKRKVLVMRSHFKLLQVGESNQHTEPVTWAKGTLSIFLWHLSTPPNPGLHVVGFHPLALAFKDSVTWCFWLAPAPCSRNDEMWRGNLLEA